jgi:hypothetical protein
MPKEDVLKYIEGLRQDAQDCMYSWREAEQARLSADGVRNEDLYRFSDSLAKHPLQSLINKLTRDHQSISNGEAIRPPDLKEFMPNHYSITFPVTKKWGSEYPTEIPLPVTYMPGLPSHAGPLSFAGHEWTEEELENFKIVMDSATNPDQSGYLTLKADENGSVSVEPITKDEFYKKTAVEIDSGNADPGLGRFPLNTTKGIDLSTGQETVFFKSSPTKENHRMSDEQIKEFSEECHNKEMESLGYKIAGETDSFEKNVAFMNKIERDKAMLAAQIADDFNIKIEDDMDNAEQKIKDGIIERGGE